MSISNEKNNIEIIVEREYGGDDFQRIYAEIVAKKIQVQLYSENEEIVFFENL